MESGVQCMLWATKQNETDVEEEPLRLILRGGKSGSLYIDLEIEGRVYQIWTQDLMRALLAIQVSYTRDSFLTEALINLLLHKRE